MNNYLETLSAGLLDVSGNSLIKDIYYTELNHCVDNYYFIFYDDLITKAMNNYHVDLKSEMNQSIKKYFNADRDSDYITNIYSWFNSFDIRIRPQIVVPHFSSFLEDDSLLTYSPQIGWYAFENDGPLHCINCAESLIYKGQAHAYITWFVALYPSPIYYINGNPSVWITNCTAKTWPIPSAINTNCQNCSQNPVSVTQNALGTCSTNNHELRIDVKAINKTDDNDICLNVGLINSPYIHTVATGNYAILRKVPGFDYYKWLHYPNNEDRVQKVLHPIVDYNHSRTTTSGAFNIPLWGDVLTLCENENYFEALSVLPMLPTSPQFRYSNAFGGIYSIFRPGIPGISHLYFAYPWARGLWWSAAPDLTIRYNNQIDPNSSTGYCSSANIRRAKEELYDLCGNNFYPTANAVFSSALGNVMDYLVTTDLNTIKDFWNDNVITIGLVSGSGYATNNYYDFEASFTPPAGCSIPIGSQILQQFIFNSSGEYEVAKAVKLGTNPVPVGTTLYINVIANFMNGESINENKCIIVNNNAIDNAVIQFRGNLKDYDSAITNYLVTVYH